MNQFTALFFFFFCTIVRFVTFFVRWWLYENLNHCYNWFIIRIFFKTKNHSLSTCCPASDILRKGIYGKTAKFHVEWHKILNLDIFFWKFWNEQKSRENAPLLFGIWLSWRFIEAACKQICNERQSSFWGRICLIDFWKVKWICKKIMMIILITP